MGRLRRLAGDEGGFSLTEMMVTLALMIVVLFAVYSVFDMSVRVYTFGNDKVEAVDNARVAMSRMERELRAAYPYNAGDTSSANDYVIFDASTPPNAATALNASRIRFGNDLGTGNRQVDNAEIIEYSVSGGTLFRKQGSGALEPLVALGPTGGLTLSYLAADGVTPVTTEAAVRVIRIRLTVDEGTAGDPRTQTLTTDVHVRNR